MLELFHIEEEKRKKKKDVLRYIHVSVLAKNKHKELFAPPILLQSWGARILYKLDMTLLQSYFRIVLNYLYNSSLINANNREHNRLTEALFGIVWDYTGIFQS